MSSLFSHVLSYSERSGQSRNSNVFVDPMLKRTTHRTGFGRDGEKHVKLCLDASQSFYNLALFSLFSAKKEG